MRLSNQLNIFHRRAPLSLDSVLATVWSTVRVIRVGWGLGSFSLVQTLSNLVKSLVVFVVSLLVLCDLRK